MAILLYLYLGGAVIWGGGKAYECDKENRSCGKTVAVESVTWPYHAYKELKQDSNNGNNHP